MDIKEALEIMCRRCSSHEMCMGTGCEPRRRLKEVIEIRQSKKPKIEDDGESAYTVCPSCGSWRIGNGLKNAQFSAFCPDCGQNIDWRSDDDRDDG